MYRIVNMGVTPKGVRGLQPPKFEVGGCITLATPPPRISSGHRRTIMATPHCLTQSYANDCEVTPGMRRLLASETDCSPLSTKPKSPIIFLMGYCRRQMHTDR
jgi:hypothetical protein